MPRVVGLVLVAAATLKLWRPEAPTPVGSHFAAGEIILGVLLILGIAKTVTLRVTAACFASFAVYAVTQAVAGAETCSCFGAVVVHPWAVAAFDVAVLSCLLIDPATRLFVAPRRVQVICRVALTLTAVGLIAGPAHRYLGDSFDTRPLVILEPREWLGQRLPLGDALDLSALDEGTWNVLFYDRACPRCRDALERCRAAVTGGSARLAVIVLPGEEDAPPGGMSIDIYRLPATSRWTIQDAGVLRVEGGLVTGVGIVPAAEGDRADG